MKEIQQDLVKWEPSGQKEESQEVHEQAILLRAPIHLHPTD
jgi:hypothetical protein